MNDKRLLVKNSLSGIIQLIITAILTFVSVPVLISKLGLDLYGVFAVLSVISNLSTLADLGMDRALIVYLSKQGKVQESNYDIWVALCIKFFLLIVILALGFIFEHFVLFDIFAIPENYHHDSIIFYRLILLSNFFMILGMSFASILDALQKVYINSLYRLLYSILYWGGIVVFVLWGYGLKEIGLISVLSALIWFIFTVIAAIKFWGKISITGLYNNFNRILKKQLSYSSKIFSASLLSLLFEPLSKVLISNFVGLSCVALFDIALRIRGQIASLFSKAIYPLGPYIANTSDFSYLQSLIINVTKLIHLLVIPFALVLAFTSKALIYIWLGPENSADLSLFVSILCGSFLLLVPPTYPIYQYLYTKLLAGKTVYIQLVNVFVNGISFLLLYKFLGMYTILISNVLAYVFSYVLSMIYLKSYIGNINRGHFYRSIILSIAGMIMICMLILKLVPFSLWDLLIYPVTLLIVYICFIRYFSLVKLAEIQNYFRPYPKVVKCLSLILK